MNVVQGLSLVLVVHVIVIRQLSQYSTDRKWYKQHVKNLINVSVSERVLKI
jgi:hypothetical protein